MWRGTVVWKGEKLGDRQMEGWASFKLGLKTALRSDEGGLISMKGGSS